MQKRFLILAVLLFFTDCDSRKDSVGEFNEIIIVTSKVDKDLVYPYINSIFSKYINTPLKENIFKIKWIYADDFFKYKYYKNIVIISLDNPQDQTSDPLFNKFKTSTNNENVFANYNVFAKNQIILNIGAYDSIELSDITNKYNSWIYDLFDDEISNRLLNAYKINEMNDELIDTIDSKFSFYLPIDENFHLIHNKKDFIWVGRGYPYRWITIHRLSGNIESDNFANLYKDLIKKTMKDVTIVDDYIKFEYKKKIMIIRGLYEHGHSDTGGPFFTYIVKNNTNNELTFISGFVNNPGKSKYYLLKQLESIINLNIKDILK